MREGGVCFKRKAKVRKGKSMKEKIKGKQLQKAVRIGELRQRRF